MAENDTRELHLRFAPNTIEHLGVKMYSSVPPVVAELLANSYDADATEVRISLYDIGEKKIIVSDNGHGMAFDELEEKFLTIGRNRRVQNGTDKSPSGRKVIGKKGLGKLSFFGIAHEIEVTTVKNRRKNAFLMEWDVITKKESEEGGIASYSPKILKLNEPTQEDSGTIITLRKIQRVTDFDPEALADSISKYFILRDDFNIKVAHNDADEIEIDNLRHYSTLPAQIEWRVPDDVKFSDSCEYSEKITGHILTTIKPIAPKTDMRGITLFSRKKLVNLPGYFAEDTSSHFFSYLTGWLEVDFIDELDEDVIGTNRQSLNWDHPEMKKLKLCLQGMLGWLEQDWRTKRRNIRIKHLNDELEKRHGMTIGEWQKNVPETVQQDLTPILQKLVGDSELSSEEITGAVKHLKAILPPYTYYHYRHLHPILSKEVFKYYKNQDYYNAVAEGVKRYQREVREKTGSSLTDRALLENVFANNSQKQWSVTQKFKLPNGDDFDGQTTGDIEKGHQKLVLAIWEAFRNPLSHNPIQDLEDSGLYTEKDCLDALSLLSHLFRRLDSIEKIAP